jgi:hypothetical protein
MHRQQVLVDLQCILQLDDRTRVVLAFEALQGIFVQSGCLGVGGVRKPSGHEKAGGKRNLAAVAQACAGESRVLDVHPAMVERMPQGGALVFRGHRRVATT